MKKIVLFAAFILTLATLSNAQQAVRFGFQLSPSFNWMSTDKNTVSTNGSNLGLRLGLKGEFYFQENYALTTGLGFSFNAGGTLLHRSNGQYWINSDVPMICRNDFAAATSTPNLKYSMQYVEIPIGLKMRTREFGYLRYFAEPNIGLGFRTQAKGEVRNPVDEEACTDLNIRDDVRLFNLFWGIDGGIEYSISESTSIVGGIGVQFGFVDSTKNDDEVFTDMGTVREDSKAVVRSFIIRLGVMF